MAFYALIFLYTPRKSRDFVSEKLHDQTRLGGRIAKRFGSLWIRQDSHFSGKLNIPLKKSCVRHNPLWYALSCLGTSQGAVYREPDPPLSPSDQQDGVGIGKTCWNQAQTSLMGLLFRRKYSSRDAYYEKTWPAASHFPFFLLSLFLCWALKDIGNQICRGEQLKHKSVLASLSYFLLPCGPSCNSLIHSTWIVVNCCSIVVNPTHKGKGNFKVEQIISWWLI